MLIIVLIFSLLFFYLCWRRTLAGIYLITAFLPSYLIRFSVLGIPMTLLEVMILILFLVCLLKKEINFKKITDNPFFWPLAAFLFFAAVSIIVSPDKIRALGIYKAYFIEPALFFAVLISVIKSRKALEGLFWSLGVSAIYLGLFSLWQKFSAWGVPQAFLNKDGTVDRVVSVFGYPNALGLYLGPIIILYSGWLLIEFKKNWQAVVKVFVIILSFAVVVLAKSEGALVAMSAIWLCWALAERRTRIPALIISAIGIIILITLEPLRAFILEKLLLNDWSGMVRKQIWMETWAMLQDNWFFGAGLAGYQLKIVFYHWSANWMEIYLYPHNIFLNFWSELGLLGLVAFIWLEVKYFCLNIKNFIELHGNKSSWEKILAAILVAVMAEIIIHGLVDAPFFKNDLSVLFIIFLAATAINGYLIENKNAGK